MIVGLTHMRVPQDQELPAKSLEVDILLGGHDHIKMEELINNVPVIKSGCNFYHLSVIHAYEKDQNENAKYQGRKFDFDVCLHQIPISEEGRN